MGIINRDDIHIAARHSRWGQADVQLALDSEANASREDWRKFGEWLLLGLGASFLVVGIVFFFAYNWADLHKFIKLAIILILITTVVVGAYVTRAHAMVSNTLMTVSVVLVGALFAVFGQIYQTGANAYDFFLGWFVFVLLWVVSTNFAPMWLVGISLLNVTLAMYFQQVATNLTGPSYCLIFLGVNILILVGIKYLSHLNKNIIVPSWFEHLLFIYTAIIGTCGYAYTLWTRDKAGWPFLILLLIGWFIFAAYFAIKIKRASYLMVIALSINVFIAITLSKISDDLMMMLFISLCMVAGITFTIIKILALQKKWNHA